MTKRLLVLLFATIALVSGGIITFRGARSRVVTPRKTQDTGFRPVVDVPASPKREQELSIFGSRVAAVLVAAVILGTGAYLGLGGSESANAGAAPVASPSPSVAGAVQTRADLSIRDEIREPVPQAASAFVNGLVDPTSEPTPSPTPVPPTATPTPRPTRRPVAAPASFPEDGFEAIICSKPWPCAEAIAVASCESGLDRNGRLDGNWATNGNNYGLFQINAVHANLWPGFYDDWMDPVKNTEWAYELWLTSGWRPWQCQP